MDVAEFQRGIDLFNEKKFFDAHEAWEDVWRAAPAGEKQFLQGLIQIAVALHHHSRGNLQGACSLLARARHNLSIYPDSYAGLDLGGIRAAVAGCQRALESGAPPPPFHIQLS